MRAAGNDTPPSATQDAGSDAGGDTWMTCREIAAARGITHAAAIRLTTRRSRHPPSDGPVSPIVRKRRLMAAY